MTHPNILLKKKDSMFYSEPYRQDSIFNDFDLDDRFDDELIKPSRKRAKLDHMSDEEKMYRRKILNRDAAQQARDRKKRRMEFLEQSVVQARSENDYLRCVNKGLETKVHDLEDRLEQLQKRLNKYAVVKSVGSQVEPLSEPAVLNSPQQSLVPWLFLLMITHLTLRTSSASVVQNLSVKFQLNHRQSQQLIVHYLRLTAKRNYLKKRRLKTL